MKPLSFRVRHGRNVDYYGLLSDGIQRLRMDSGNMEAPIRTCVHPVNNLEIGFISEYSL